MNSIFRIIPLYFLGLIAFLILNAFDFVSADYSLLNVLSHFLFLSVLNPYWWSSFPGSGYVAVLVLLWLLFPFYERKIHGFEDAAVGFFLTVCGSFCLNFILCHVPFITDRNLLGDWLSYIFRGIQSAAFGVMIFYVPELGKCLKRKKIFAYALCAFSILMAYLLVRCDAVNLLFFFVIGCFIVALQVYPIFLFCNPIFTFLGKYIFGIYIWHIVLYFLIRHFIENEVPLLLSVSACAVVLAVISTMFIERPAVRFLKKLFVREKRK